MIYKGRITQEVVEWHQLQRQPMYWLGGSASREYIQMHKESDWMLPAQLPTY